MTTGQESPGHTHDLKPGKRRRNGRAWWFAFLGALFLSSCPPARADQATLRETFSERYACRWDCPFDIPDLPGIDEDEWREDNCDRICAERLDVIVALKLVMTLPTLRGLDLTAINAFGLSAGNLDFSFEERAAGSSNRVAFTQYREFRNEFGEVTRRRTGSVLISRSGDIVTIMASRTTGGESILSGEFTHHDGATNGQYHLAVVPVRLTMGGLVVDREIPVTALTKLKTKLVKDESDPDNPVEYPKTFSTVTTTGAATWANPVVTIATPTAAQRWSNSVIRASGSVVSLILDPKVLLQLNRQGPWIELQSANGLWETALNLIPGTNRVLACAKDDAGRYSPGVAVDFVYVRTSPITLDVHPTTAVGTVVGPQNGELLEEGVNYRFAPTPAAGYLFNKWIVQSPTRGTTEILGVDSPRLAIAHETNLLIRACFVANRFVGIPKSYAGLIRPAPGSGRAGSQMDEGLVTLTLTDAGFLSGTYVSARKTVPIRSQARPDSGTARILIDSGKPTQAAGTFAFDLEHGRRVSGTLTGQPGWTSIVELFPVAAPDEIPSFVGSYVFAIPGVEPRNAGRLPGGTGSGSFKIAATGLVTGAGTAGDGTVLAFKVPLLRISEGLSTPEFYWPFFQTRNGGARVLRGFVRASATNTLEAGSPLSWTKQPNFKDALYPAGFDDAAFASAGSAPEWFSARHVEPPPGTTVPGFMQGRLTLNGGNLIGTLGIEVVVTPADKVVPIGGNPWQLGLQINRKTGIFSGTFMHPGSGAKTKITGAVLQSTGGTSTSHSGSGWFPGWNQTGTVVLEESPDASP